MTRTSQKDMGDILVWELVNVRCALARPVADDVRDDLRRREKSLVGALLDIGLLSEDAMAALPPVAEPQPALY